MKKNAKSILTIACIISLFIVGCGNFAKAETEKIKKLQTLEKIKKRGKVIVGIDATSAPFEFIENGKTVGYGPDILNEIAKNLAVAIEYQDMPFTSIFSALENEQFDFAATVVVATKQRRQKFGLTVPIGQVPLVVVKRKGDDSIQKIEDLEDKIVGCQFGGVSEIRLNKYNQKLKAQGKKEINFKEIYYYHSNLDKCLDLKNGRIDATVQSLTMMQVVMKEEPDTYEIVSEFDNPVVLCWAVRKEDEELRKFLNAEILKLQKSGQLAQLQKKWFDATWDIPDQS